MERVAAVTVRRAEPDDAPAIAELQALVLEAAQWTPAPSDDILVAEDGDRVVGFLVCRNAVSDEHELLNLAVDPAGRRRGVATALLDAALRDGPGRWFLEVRESNVSAQEFYRSQGFSRAGVRPSYYASQDPGRSPENAIVMNR